MVIVYEIDRPGFASMIPALLLKRLQVMKTRLAQHSTLWGTGISTDCHKVWHGPGAVSTDWHKVGHGPAAALTERHGPGITDQFNSVGISAVDTKRLIIGKSESWPQPSGMSPSRSSTKRIADDDVSLD